MCYNSKPQEIAKRTGIFTASGQVGSMFAGVMMTAIHKGMNGYAGLAGWKWVFLIGKFTSKISGSSTNIDPSTSSPHSIPISPYCKKYPGC